MLNLLKMEFYKLRRSILFYGIIILTAMENPVIYMLSNADKKYTGKEIFILQFEQQQYLMLMIFIGILSYLIVNEFDSGYIKNIISYGHKRIDVVISKSIMYYTAVAVAGIIFPITGCIINTITNGFGESFTFASALYMIKFILIMLLIYISIASISVVVAFITRNAAITLGICISLDTVSRILSALAMRNKTADSIYSKTVYAQTQIMIMDNVTVSQQIQTILICFITIVISTFVSAYFFKKADIK